MRLLRQIHLMLLTLASVSGCGSGTAPPHAPDPSSEPAPETRTAPEGGTLPSGTQLDAKQSGVPSAAANPQEQSGSENPAPGTSSPPTPQLPPRDPTLMRSVIRSQHQEALAPLLTDGVLPPLEELTLTQKSDVMKLMAQSVGMECTGCHVSKADFRTKTDPQRIAKQMWNEFVAGKTLDAAPVFCDSCHQGSAKILQPQRPADLKRFMKTEFQRLKDESGSQVTCKSCHGTPFEGSLIEKRWGLLRVQSSEGEESTAQPAEPTQP